MKTIKRKSPECVSKEITRHFFSIWRLEKDILRRQHLSQDLNHKPEKGWVKATGGTGPKQGELGLPGAHSAARGQGAHERTGGGD